MDGDGGFNPRAREGRDSPVMSYFWAISQFQSTRPRGARRDLFATGMPVTLVSIHAPARGATLRSMLKGTVVSRFNPRAREGRDPLPLVCPSSATSFNPRAREGRDADPRPGL